MRYGYLINKEFFLINSSLSCNLFLFKPSEKYNKEVFKKIKFNSENFILISQISKK